MKGTIALDIDGTITRDDHLIPDEVAFYLESLFKEGWQIILVTGRTLSFALSSIQKLQFSYLLGLQNGADLLQMPEKTPLKQNYFGIEVVHALDKLYVGLEEDMLIYSGFESGDFFYYRPKKFSQKFLLYLDKLKNLAASLWQEVESFDEITQKSFPLIKCVGLKAQMEALDKKVQEIEGVRTSVIRDLINRDYYLILVTHENAIKGVAVRQLMKQFSLKGPLICAGDDNNDLSMIQEADVKIVMPSAPKKLLDIADIIAPPANDCGIISALKDAMERLC